MPLLEVVMLNVRTVVNSKGLIMSVALAVIIANVKSWKLLVFKLNLS